MSVFLSVVSILDLFPVSLYKPLLYYFSIKSELLIFLTCCPRLPHRLFSQELVSIGTEGRNGDLSVLGNIKHKMVCSPDFEALLESNA